MNDPRFSGPTREDHVHHEILDAIRELGAIEDSAALEAELDALATTPLPEPSVQRVLKRVHAEITRETRATESRAPNPGRIQSHSGLQQVLPLVVCLSLLAVVAIALQSIAWLGETPQLVRHRNASPLIADSESRTTDPLDQVTEGQTLQTGPREKRRVRLPDGSLLSMNVQSRIQVTGHRRLKLLAGEVFLEAIPARTPRDRFVLETPDRTVTALGTKFLVNTQGRGTQVVVTQGEVRVTGVPGSIPAGQELVASGPSAAPVIQPAHRSAAVVDWLRDLVGNSVAPASEHSGGSMIVVDSNGQEMRLSLQKFHVDVHIEDGFARTTIDQTYFNHTWQQQEATFRFPLPADASLSRLAMYVNGTLMEGGMVERDHGRNVYEQIRHTRRDPALLEWVDGSTFQMRIFPLEPRQEKRVLLSYTQRLPVDYGKRVYRFPAGHSFSGVRSWSARFRIRGAAGQSWVSPSHLLQGRDEGRDLLLEGREELAVLDRDLVVELQEKPSTATTWSFYQQRGQQYLMLRSRPELPAGERRPPRQWIFLVENTADRDRLLAETQRQIVKVLLDNVEHSDLISVVRVGTRSDSFQAEPVLCSRENAAAAVEFLKQEPPLGALDLERALQSVKQLPRPDRDVWMVHVGSGIPVLGERDPVTLIRQLPERVRFAGIAVGKRWSRPYLEGAATRTGGLVTQINPDEAVAWRAFDVLSTLNAPRLTGVTLKFLDGASPGNPQEEPRFLSLTPTVAQGQELAVVARITSGQAIAKQVQLTAMLDGKPFQQTFTIPEELLSKTPAAGGPPVALGPSETVPDRCGYLPRTWARLEIDRLVDLGAADHKEQIIALSKSLQVMSPFTSLLVLETEAMYDQFKVDRGQEDHWAAYPAPRQIPVVADLPTALAPLDAARVRLREAKARIELAQANLDRRAAEGKIGFDQERLTRILRDEQAQARLLKEEVSRLQRIQELEASPIRRAERSIILRRRAVYPPQVWTDHYFGANPILRNWSRPEIHTWYFDSSGLGLDTFSVRVPTSVSVPTSAATFQSFSDLTVNEFSAPALQFSTVLGEPALSSVRTDVTRFARIPDVRFDTNGRKFSLISDESRFATPAWIIPNSTASLGKADQRYLNFGNEFLMYGSNRGWITLPFLPASTELLDLPSQAPALQTRPADYQSATEQVEPAPRGAVDPEARQWIDRARTSGWVRIRRVLPTGASDIPCDVIADGTGRFVLHREVGERLRETVIHDGTTLVHQYPDLGLGAVRTSSRFHRAEFHALIPWMVPSVEDLSAGADLKRVGVRVVRIVPHSRQAGPAGDKPRATAVVELEFSEAGPLAEVRVLDPVTWKLLSRQVFSTSGLVQRFDGKNRLIEEQQYERLPAAEPTLTPAADLVLLPLPYRSLESLAVAVPSNLQTSRPDYSSTTEQDALALLAAYFAEANGNELAALIEQRFFARNDLRIGLLVLLGATQPNHGLVGQARSRHPDSPLARFLEQVAAYSLNGNENAFEADPSAGRFLSRLRETLRLQIRWTRDLAVANPSQAEFETELEAALKIIQDLQSEPLAANLLMQIEQSLRRKDRLATAIFRQLSFTAGTVAVHLQRPEFLRLQRIDWALRSEDAAQTTVAQTLFAEHLAERPGRESMPELTSEVRAAFGQNAQTPEGESCVAWARIVLDSARGWLAEGHRAGLIDWAQRCLTLGERDLAARLYDLAVRDQDLDKAAALNAAALRFCKAAGRWEEARLCVQRIREQEGTQPKPLTLREAAEIAFQQKRYGEWIQDLDRAAELEFATLPTALDLQAFRQSYEALFTSFDTRADQLANAPPEERQSLVRIVLRAASRWREVDPEEYIACHRAARVLSRLSFEAAAWDYWTTPLSEMPDQSSSWIVFAEAMGANHRFNLADQAWTTAFACEPTNPEILLKHAQFLASTGRRVRANELLDRIVKGTWQPRFDAVKQQAQTLIGP